MAALRTDEELLAECDVETFRSSGPGGQNVNRRETAVRLRHRPTGIVVTCQKERSQFRNKQLALDILRERLCKRARKRRPRVPTRVPKVAVERRIQEKRRRGEKKEQRRPVGRQE